MVGLVASFLISTAVCFVVTRVGPALGYVDRPDDPTLKVHVQPAVPLGGVGIFVAVHSGLAVSGLFGPWLFASSAILLGLGLVDDRSGLGPRIRLAVEVVAGWLLAVGVAPRVGWVAAIFLAFALVVAVNAINLFDGLDGLVGSSALVAALGIAGLGALRGVEYRPALILAAALGGFLLFNWHPARVFLGDNGAYSLAAYLVAGIALTAPAEPSLLDLIVGVGILGVFLVDLVSTVLRRYLAKQPLFVGDRNHTYDRLHSQGRSVPAVTMITAAAQVVIVGAVVGLAISLPSVWAALATAVIGLAAIAAVAVGPWLPTAVDPSP